MTYAELASKISNIRYGRLGTVIFECNGRTVTIAEPQDVILVGFNDEAASHWIARNYNFLVA